MPIFEYQCADCGNVMDFMEKASAKGKHICDKCKSDKMSKQFSSFAVGRAGCNTSQECPGCTNFQCPHSN